MEQTGDTDIMQLPDMTNEAKTNEVTRESGLVVVGNQPLVLPPGVAAQAERDKPVEREWYAHKARFGSKYGAGHLLRWRKPHAVVTHCEIEMRLTRTHAIPKEIMARPTGVRLCRTCKDYADSQDQPEYQLSV